MIIDGYLYAPNSSSRTKAKLVAEIGGREFRIVHAGSKGVEAVAITGYIEAVANTAPSIHLDDGRMFSPAGAVPPEFNAMFGGTAGNLRSRAENAGWKLSVILIVLFLGSIAALRFSVPYIADGVTALLPRSFDRTIGALAFAQAEKALFYESKLSQTDRDRIKDAARGLAVEMNLSEVPVMHFRAAPRLGANAFAFPGGPVIVTDDLVKLLGSDDHILAIVTHEYAHVEQRHGMRQVLRLAGLVVMLSTFVGAGDEVMEGMSTLALSLLSLGYSREFETDADRFAVHALETTGKSSDLFAEALAKIVEKCGKACESSGWLSTHPGLNERIEALK